jgi:hypothetical protein
MKSNETVKLNPIKFQDNTFRDGRKSIYATRMKTEDMIPMTKEMDSCGFHAMDVWGGATFDTMHRFLGEDPGMRPKTLKRRFVYMLNFLFGLLDLKIVRSDAKYRFPDALFPKNGYKLYPEIQSKSAQVLRMSCLDEQRIPTAILRVDKPISVEVDFCVRDPELALNVSFMIHDLFEDWVSATHTNMVPYMPSRWTRGQYRVRMEFPSGILNCGQYYIRVGIGHIDGTIYDYHHDGLSLELVANGPVLPHTIHSHGLLAVIPDFVVVPIVPDESNVLCSK